MLGNKKKKVDRGRAVRGEKKEGERKRKKAKWIRGGLHRGVGMHFIDKQEGREAALPCAAARVQEEQRKRERVRNRMRRARGEWGNWSGESEEERAERILDAPACVVTHS